MTTKEEKYHRKRFLMDIGVKDYPSLPSIGQRYSYIYRIAHACFDCRKSFKIEVEYLTYKGGHNCPQCGNELQYLGRSFKAPKQKDTKQWEKVRRLIKAGFVFFSYRSFPEAEPLPETLQEVDAFIERNTDHPMRLGR